MIQHWLFFSGRRRRNTAAVQAYQILILLPHLLMLFILCSTVISCASVQTDIQYSGNESAIKEQALADIEAALVMQRGAPNTERLGHIRAEINALLQAPSTDSSYLARLYALAADTALLLRQPSEARTQLALAKRYSEYDEYVQLVTARLIAEPEKQLAYLEERITQEPAAYRLKAEAGSLFFAAKDYRNALAAFDASLSFLPDAYQQYYRPQREQCVQLYTVDSASVTESSEKILQANPISLVEMAALTQDSTNALDFITGTAVWRPPLLAKTLQQAGWYHPDRDVLKDSASKKDAALFLWRLIIGSDEQRLTQYTRYYTNKRRLPIPDVLMDGIYFDAIVGSVEEDVVPLADGKHFEPDTPVSGLEFYRWLLKADAIR
nr:hypothetical protein [uncultured Treponema sp.]